MCAIPAVHGFGVYALPQGKTFEQVQLIAKVQKIALAILFSIATYLLFPSILALIPAFFAVKSILGAIGISYRAPPISSISRSELGKVHAPPCNGFVTKDGTESHTWRLNLIRAAKQNIFISGCYCGGKTFDETLDVIQRQMQRVPALQVTILSSDMFITAENTKNLQTMAREFGNRFSYEITPEVTPYTSMAGELSFRTNHTKTLIIDAGAAFMTGGSGLVTPWAEQKGETEPKQVESHGVCYDHLFKMRAFRDMDFVFQSTADGVGPLIHKEMRSLYDQLRYPKPKLVSSDLFSPTQLALPLSGLKMAAYTSGPDNQDASFLNEIIAQINSAKTSILIAHMYFHPTPEMQTALKAALKRGVAITLLTNQSHAKSPTTHLSYAELSRFYAKNLPGLQLYEFTVPYTTLHKKVLLFDQKTALLGTSNIGHNSLKGSHYELNVKVESEEFATSIAKIIENDKLLCKKNEANLSLKTKVLSSLSSLFTPFL